MKKTLATLLVMAALGSAARAQCTSYDTVIDIAANIGDGALVDEQLSDGSEFYLLAGEDGTVSWSVGETAAGPYTGWPDDADGNAILEYGDYACTLKCDGQGGITVVIEDLDQDKFTPAAWTVSASGVATAAPPPVACNCAGSGTRNQVTCTPQACKNTNSCKYTGAFPGTPSGWCVYGTGGGGGD